MLQRAGLVRADPRGTRRVYSIRREGLDELRRYLESFWSDVLDAYGAEVVRREESEMIAPLVKTIEVPCRRGS